VADRFLSKWGKLRGATLLADRPLPQKKSTCMIEATVKSALAIIIAAMLLLVSCAKERTPEELVKNLMVAF
jgi:hypothetical protein